MMSNYCVYICCRLLKNLKLILIHTNLALKLKFEQ